MAVRAGAFLGERLAAVRILLVQIDEIGDGHAFGKLQRRFDGIGQTLADTVLDHQTIHHHFDGVLLLLGELDVIGQLPHLTVDQRTRVTIATQQFEQMKQYYESYMREVPCQACHGRRLRPEVLTVTVGDESIADVCDMSAERSLAWINGLELEGSAAQIAGEVVKEIRARLGFLNDVGLNYLTLSRAAKTLSGGEAQRIRLATQIGSGLVGVMYVLDEPSIGLHQRDNERLIGTLHHLRDLGNTLIVVEHDEDTIRNADWVIDIGPGAGEHGGEVVYSGPTVRWRSRSASCPDRE